MYAIVDIAGKQFKVEKDRFVYAPSLAGEAGASVEFDRVLLIEDDNGVEVGTPTVSGARVAGTIMEHGRGDKVIVFKKKRRKGYKKKQGHRQGYSKIMIDDILLQGQKASKKPKKEETPQAETKPTEKAAPTNQDDLKKINGLGPKFEEALNEYGIYTYQGLTELSSDTIGRLSDDIDGISAEMLEDDWIPQAKELIGTSDTEEATTAADDLKNISGIGPAFEKALNEHGIHTYQQIIDLSAEEIEKLAEEVDGVTVEMVQDDWIPQAKELESQKEG